MLSTTHDDLTTSRIYDDDDENNTSDESLVTSAVANAEMAAECPSEASTNDSLCSEYQTGGDGNHSTISTQDSAKQLCRMFCHPSRVLLEKNTLTFVLIPAMLIMVYQVFGTIMHSSDPSNTRMTIPLLRTLSIHVFHQYMRVLEEYPLLVQSITTGIIQFFGDYAAQRYERKQHTKNQGYDVRRGVSLLVDGFVLSGPLMHYCYEWMEEHWPTTSEGGLDEDEVGGLLERPLTTLFHVFVNDYFLDTTYIALSFVFTGVVEGYSSKEICRIIRKDFWGTVRASWLTSFGLIPVEIVCFGYLSLSFRVLAMNFVDLLWGAIISFYSHKSRRENDLSQDPPPQEVVEAKTKSDESRPVVK